MTDPSDKIRERLAEVVTDFNSTTDPGERIDLYGEMEKLRADLRRMEAGQ